MPTAAPAFETGRHTDVTIAAGVVSKVTFNAYPNKAEAEDLCGQLEMYHAAVAAGPLAVAELLGTEVVAGEDGYHVKHVMGFLDGPSLGQLPEEERRAAVGSLAHTLYEVPVCGDGRLVVPIDAKARNFRMCGNIAVLVDICPPFAWGTDGYVTTSLDRGMDFGTRVQTSAMVGYRSGVLSDVLLAAVPDFRPGETAKSHALRALVSAPDWYSEFVPAGLPPTSKEALGSLIEVKLMGRLQRTLM